MAPEAPDPNGGGPGHVGEGKNGLSGSNIMIHIEAKNIYFLYALLISKKKGYLEYFRRKKGGSISFKLLLKRLNSKLYPKHWVTRYVCSDVHGLER